MNWQPKNPDFRAFVERFFAAQPYLGLLGAELGRVEPGLAEYRVPLRAELTQQNGFLHGGVTGGVAEAVMGAAAATLVPASANLLGVSYTINLMSPVTGEALLARGQVIKPGRRLMICRADMFGLDAAGEERLCAIAQGTIAMVDGGQNAPTP